MKLTNIKRNEKMRAHLHSTHNGGHCPGPTSNLQTLITSQFIVCLLSQLPVKMLQWLRKISTQLKLKYSESQCAIIYHWIRQTPSFKCLSWPDIELKIPHLYSPVRTSKTWLSGGELSVLFVVVKSCKVAWFSLLGGLSVVTYFINAVSWTKQ